MRRTLSTVLFIFFFFPVIAGAIKIKPDFVTNSRKNALMLSYVKDHYAMTNLVIVPRMIVIHYTENRSYQKTIEYFRHDEISPGRPLIYRYGRVNVGTQFVVDRLGGIHQLYPETYPARHVTGFNYMAIGIENVSLNARRLTASQLEANRQLIRYLVKKYPTIEFLIGHHEYNQTNLPHFKHYKDYNDSFRLEPAYDPGAYFMQRLRSLLAKDGIRLKN